LSILILVITGSMRLPPSPPRHTRALSPAPRTCAPRCALVPVTGALVVVPVTARSSSPSPERPHFVASSLILGWLHAHGTPHLFGQPAARTRVCLAARKLVSATGTEKQLMWILGLRVPHGVLKENSRRDP
jgi:hypothetical protein